MLMSHSHKFIFIHIYKTAGTSVANEFVPYSRLLDRMAYEYRFSRIAYGRVINLMGWHGGGMKQFTGYHKHAKAYQIEEKLGSNIFNSYYKFAFVRHPFDFIASLYFYLLQAKTNVSHKMVSGMNFSDFLKWHLSRNPPLQIDFLMNRSRDRRLVDYVGRYESLSKDVSNIKKHLNLENSGRIEHMNPSVKRKSKDYKDYYGDEEKNLLLDYFRHDFEILGYDYDGFHDHMQLMKQF